MDPRPAGSGPVDSAIERLLSRFDRLAQTTLSVTFKKMGRGTSKTVLYQNMYSA
jgi:hypothetical protein